MRHWKYYRYSEVVKMRLWLLHDRIKSLSAHKEFAKMRQSEFDIARRYWDGKMKSRPYEEFPKNIKNLTWDIYPSKKLIVVSGFKYFDLRELKKINPDIMFSLPCEIFIAISGA